MLPEFSAQAVALEVLEHLERRRPSIAHDEAQVRAEVRTALEPIRRAYDEAELPRPYFAALEEELTATLPDRWRAMASRFTELEKRDFGLWRGGDPIARIVYVFVGLVVGGLCVELPFIPIWEKWFPFVLAIAAGWLPTAQVAWQKRRYARELGALALKMAGAQPRLEEHVTLRELLDAPKEDSAPPRGASPGEKNHER